MKTGFDKLLLDDSPDAVIATTVEGRIVYWSSGAESVFGYNDAEAVGRTVYDLIVPPDRAEEEQGALRALETGVATYEAVRRRKDGSCVYVDITSKVVRDAAGEVEFVLSSKKDITELKVMRDARLIEARFRDLLESMPDAIVIVHPSGRIMITNTQAEKLFGYHGGTLRGKPVELLLPPRYHDAHVTHRAGYFTEPRRRAMGMGLELYGLRRDGTEFPVEISLSPLSTDEGTVVMSAIRDITERKRFERQLQEKNIELANANRAKDTFLASMSHELRTPLNAIIGFTGTLLMQLPGPLTTDQDKQLRTVRSSARHLLALINDLLDVAKIEAGRIELDYEPVACRGMVEELVSTLRPEAGRKGIALDVVMPDAELVLQTDRRALHQILLNLANNAIKFTEQGGVRIVVGRRAGGGRSAIEFSIEDTGVGIRGEDQAKLFTPFTQIDAARGRSREGSGLGLYVSRKLAEVLGGEIHFRSEFGKGSAFALTLPEQ